MRSLKGLREGDPGLCYVSLLDLPPCICEADGCNFLVCAACVYSPPWVQGCCKVTCCRSSLLTPGRVLLKSDLPREVVQAPRSQEQGPTCGSAGLMAGVSLWNTNTLPLVSVWLQEVACVFQELLRN